MRVNKGSLCLRRRAYMTDIGTSTETGCREWEYRDYHGELFWRYRIYYKGSSCRNYHHRLAFGSREWLSRWHFWEYKPNSYDDWGLYVSCKNTRKIDNSYRSCNQGWIYRRTKISRTPCRCRTLPWVSSYWELSYSSSTQKSIWTNWHCLTFSNGINRTHWSP